MTLSAMCDGKPMDAQVLSPQLHPFRGNKGMHIEEAYKLKPQDIVQSLGTAFKQGALFCFGR